MKAKERKNNFTVRRKISLGFGVLLLLIIVLGSLAIKELASSNNRIKEIYENHLKGVQYIEQANVNLTATERDEKSLILATEAADIEKAFTSFKDNSTNFTINVANYRGTVSVEAEKVKLKEIIKVWEDVMPLQDEMSKYAKENKDSEAQEVAKKIKEKVGTVEADLLVLTSKKIELSKTSYEESKALFENTLTMVLGLIVIAVVISIVVGFYITKMISRPLVAMAEAASKIADGDLTIDPIKVRNKDEIGSLSESFNKMALDLKNIIMKIVDVSEVIVTSSEELSASVEETTASTELVTSTISELTSNTTDQSEEVIKVNTILNEISAKIQQSASNCTIVSNASMNVSETAKHGVLVSQDAVKKIELLEKTSIKTSEVINLLAFESDKIGQIVDVIAAIAEQTNLLALNAAIEAARAGENGRGFAVVAEEIRKLAEKSSLSTKDITELVKNIQYETEHAKKVIKESNEKVIEGVEAVNNAGKSFEVIVAEIDNVVEQITHVNEASQQIATNSNDVVERMNNVSAISEQNVASSEEILATSEDQALCMEEISKSSQELAVLSAQLKEVVDKFKY
jgi:methyl-accepting chemotaxis protein